MILIIVDYWTLSSDACAAAAQHIECIDEVYFRSTHTTRHWKCSSYNRAFLRYTHTDWVYNVHWVLGHCIIKMIKKNIYIMYGPHAIVVDCTKVYTLYTIYNRPYIILYYINMIYNVPVVHCVPLQITS